MSAKLMVAADDWAGHGVTHARGQAYDPAGTLLRATALATLFDGLDGHDAWLETSAGLNGCFAVVRIDAAEARASVDRLRSIPLFFAETPDGFAIADTGAALRALLPGSGIDPASAAEFRLTGYVTGEQTLIEGLHTVRAGHCLFRAAGTGSTHELRRYYAFRHDPDLSQGVDELIGKLVAIHERVFRRLLDDVGDRPIVVPLSGGFDSRLIGVSLRDAGCRNVLCYSYGADGNWEARISRELAQYLGFRWTMIPYSGENWRQWSGTPEFAHYFGTAGNFSAVPHLQDWPAVYELQRRGELPQDAVFVPGHSGDFLAGSHVPKQFLSQSSVTRDDVLRSILDGHYSLWDWPTENMNALADIFRQRIECVTGTIATGTPEDAADVFERWDCEERQAKFIVNSVRVYEAFGHQWRLPLFDAELMGFWSRVPVEHRAGRRLYFEFVRRHQQLPVTRANTDRSAPVEQLIRWVNRSGLRPLAKRMQQAWRRARWRRQYEGGDLCWFALVDPDEFRSLYTGREIGHSFLALRYLDAISS